MGLFEDLGERVERFKQQATDASKESADYECLACGEPVYTDQGECPNCGSEDVAAREPVDEASDGAAPEPEEPSADGSVGDPDAEPADDATTEPADGTETSSADETE